MSRIRRQFEESLGTELTDAEAMILYEAVNPAATPDQIREASDRLKLRYSAIARPLSRAVAGSWLVGGLNLSDWSAPGMW